MMKKLLNIIAIILIIFFAGYFIYNEFIAVEDNTLMPDKQADTVLPDKKTAPSQTIKQSKTIDKTTFFLNSIEKETQISFSDVGKSDFEWILNDKGDRATIKGKKISAQTTFNNSEKIYNYFRASGFVMDRYNIADGTVSSLSGFEKEQIVCAILTRSKYEELEMPTESIAVSVEINCGILDAEQIVNEKTKNEEIIETDDEAIVRVFKQQYPDYGLGEEITINCSKKTTTHARCMAVFAGAYSAPYFLAVKTDGSWIIPFIGQDVPLCADIEPYNFPISMVPECWDSENKKWKKLE